MAGSNSRYCFRVRWERDFGEEPCAEILLLVGIPLLPCRTSFDLSKIEGAFDAVVAAMSLGLMSASVAGHFWLAPPLHRRQSVRSSLGIDMLSA
jgi:hypothetical protein